MNKLIYDDHCPMCRAQMKLLRRLDWFRTIEFIPASDPRALQSAPGLTSESLMTAIHCVSPGGRVLRGASALRQVGLRIPLLTLPSLLLWVPGMLRVADRVYATIARNRYVLSRFFGCQDACELPTVRK